MIRSLLLAVFVTAAVATISLAVLTRRQDAPAAQKSVRSSNNPSVAVPKQDESCFQCTIPAP
jgi:hypothetical protein